LWIDYSNINLNEVSKTLNSHTKTNLKLSNWISTKNQLPDDLQRVLVFIPNNEVYLPGKTGDKERVDVLVMKFHFNFLTPEKATEKKTARHFWVGEGQSNHYFEDVTHWQPMPSPPKI
jgi:hypothetical protein